MKSNCTVRPDKKLLFDPEQTSKYNNFLTLMYGEEVRERIKNGKSISTKESIDEIYDRISLKIFYILSNDVLKNNIQWLGEDKIDTFTRVDLRKLLRNYSNFTILHRQKNPFFSDYIENINEAIEKSERDDSDSDSLEDKIPEDENQERNLEYDLPANARDPFKGLKTERIIFEGLLAKNPDGSYIKDLSGLPILTPAKIVFTNLIGKVNSIKDEIKMKDLILDEGTIKLVPEISQIIDLLGLDNWFNRSDEQKELWVRLFNTLKKPRINAESSFRKNRENKNYETVTTTYKIQNLHHNKRKISAGWKNAFRTRELNGNKISTIGESFGRSFIDIDSMMDYPEKEFQAKKFLQIFGMYVDPNAITDKNENEINNQITITAQILWNKFDQIFRLNPKFKTFDPMEVIYNRYFYSDFVTEDTPANVKFDQRNLNSKGYTVDNLLTVASKYSSEIPSLAYKDPKGELRNSISEENNLLLTAHYLNESESIEDLKKTVPFIQAGNDPLFEASIYINNMYPSGIRKKNIFIPKTIMVGYNEDTQVKAVKDLTDRQKLLFDIDNTLLYGKSDIPRTSTSNSFFTVGLSYPNGTADRMPEERPLFSFDNFRNDIINGSEVKEQYLKYLNAEIKRVASAKSKKSKHPFYDKFSIFHFLYDAGDGFTDKLKEPVEYDSEIANEFFNRLSKYLNEELTKQKKLLEENSITSSDIATNTLDGKYNSPTSEWETKLSKEDFFNALMRMYVVNAHIQNIEYTILFSGDPLFFVKVKNEKAVSEWHKRNQKDVSTGNYLNTSDTAWDLIENSDYQKKYSLRNYRNKANSKKKSIEFRNDSKTLLSYTIEDITANSLGLSKKEFLYKDDMDHELTDGLSWMSLDFAHKMSIAQGWRNEYTDAAFRYEALIYKSKILKQSLTPDEQLFFNRVEEKINENPELYSISGFKAGYTGNVYNQDINGKLYVKTHFAVILPSLAFKSPKLLKLLNHSIETNTALYSHKSAQKGYVTKVHSIDNLGEPDIYASELFKLQINFKTSQNKTTSIPTQLIKLIYSNLFNDGKPTTEIADKKYKEYIKLLFSIRDDNRKILKDKLGISDEGIDYNKLSNVLLREALRRGVNDNIIKILTIGKNGKFTTTPEIYSKEVQDILASIMDKTLRKFEIPGGDFILMSDAMSENRLKTYERTKNGVTKCEIRITLDSNFKHLLKLQHRDKKPINTIDRLNEMLKNKNFMQKHEKSLTIVLDRVPTQELNSMDTGVVVEFLSPTMGNVVIMPLESILKSGSDFDYDKEKVLIPYLDKNGNYIELSNIDRQIKELKEELNITYGEFITDREFGRDIYKIREYIQDFNSNINTKIEDKEQIEEFYKKLDELIYTQAELESYIDSRDEDGNIIEDDEKLDSLEELDLVEETIKNLINSHKNLFFENGFDIVNEAYDFNKRLKYLYSLKYFKKAHIVNKIIENYSGIILLKDRYSELIKKNSAKDIEALANKMAKLSNVNIDLPIFSGTFLPSENLRVFNMFFSSKNMLAPYAKTNTIQQLLVYSGINLNRTIYKYWKNSGEPTIYNISNPLLTEEEEQTVLNEDGTYKMGNNFDSLGNYIQLMNSQIINATVDTEKDPYFRALMLSYKSVGEEIFLSNFLKVPKERSIYFLGNSMLQKFLQGKNNRFSNETLYSEIIKDLNLRYKVVKTIEGETSEQKAKTVKNTGGKVENLTAKIIDGKTFFSYDLVTYFPVNTSYSNSDKTAPYYNGLFTGKVDINNIIVGPDKGFSLSEIPDKFDMNLLEKMVDPNYKLKTKEDFLTQFKVFQYYTSINTANYAYRDLANYISFDTVKMGSVNQVEQKKKLRESIIKSNIISKEDLEKLDQNSIVGAFNNMDVIKSTFNKFLPLLTKFSRSLNRIIEDYTERYEMYDKKGLRNIPTVINNYFLYSIFHNYGDISKRGFELIRGIKEDNNIFLRWARFKKSDYYKELATKFPILTKLTVGYEVIMDKFNVLTPQFSRNPNLTPEEANSYIHQLRSLLDKNSLLTEDEEVNSRIRTLIDDFIAAGYAQSGFGISEVSIANFAPLEYFKDDFEKAYHEFRNLPEGVLSDYVNKFIDKFQFNNPSYFPSVKTLVKNEKTSILYPKWVENLNKPKYAKWFKDYNIDPSAIQKMGLPDIPLDGPEGYDLADKLPAIEQNFKDGDNGRKMQDQFKGKSTMDLIISGDRTRSTRSYSQLNVFKEAYGLKDIKDLAGHIVRMKDLNGTEVYTKITSVNIFNQEYQDATWHKEGWTKDNVGYSHWLKPVKDVYILTETQLETLKQEYYGIGIKYGQENK